MNTQRFYIPLPSEERYPLLEDWHWLVPKEASILHLTCFGDAVLKIPSGEVLFLDTIEGKVDSIAKSESDYQRLADIPENQDTWFLSGFVDSLAQQHGPLPSGRCYSWKLPPIMGGPIELSNVEISDLLVTFSISGQLHRQLKDLPPGTRISGFQIKE